MNEETNVTTEITVPDEREGGTSASNAEADGLCHGRHFAQKGRPEEASEDARFGRQIHEALATGNIDLLDTQQLSIYESMREITNDLLLKAFGVDWEKAKIFRERRFRCEVSKKPGDASVRYKHSAKPDFVSRLGSTALVVEYKCLPGDVASSPTNKQLRDQAVLISGNLLVHEVYTAVNQPLVSHTPDLCLYNKEALKQAEQEMFVRVRNSNNPDATRTAGEKQCQFCLARSDCAEYQQFAQSLIPAPATMFGVPVKDWTDEQRAKFMDGKRVAQRWLDESYSELKVLIGEFPGCVPGYKMGVGDEVKTVKDPQELFRRFVEVGRDFATNENAEMHADHVLLPFFMQCVKVGKGDFEALVRKVTGFKGKKLKACTDAMMDGIVDVSRKEGSIEKDK